MAIVFGVRFKRANKVYNFGASGVEAAIGDIVIVEVEKGLGMGRVVYGPIEMADSLLDKDIKKVLRKADAVDSERAEFNKESESEALKVCKEKIEKHKIPMKLVGVEYLFDASKAIFYFTSENRVDFRELVKDLAAHFYTRIEMRQIGVRDEAKMVGGIGPCGREFCCSSFLVDFEPVTVRMAKEQNVALNPLKISGVCGRLMCCLSYEHEVKCEKKKQAPGCGGCPPKAPSVGNEAENPAPK